MSDWDRCQLCASQHCVHMGVCMDCSFHVGDVRIGDVVIDVDGVRCEVTGKDLDSGDLFIEARGGVERRVRRRDALRCFDGRGL